MSGGRITLYGSCVSGNCLKIRWVSDRLGVDYDWVEVDLIKGETRTEEFLALNPAGQVPLAVFPDGRTLAQSNAIMVYLAEREGSDLIPHSAFERAKMLEWLFWEQYSHEPFIAVRRADKLFGRVKSEEDDQKLVAGGRRALGRMEMALLSGDYLLGDRLTLADVALVAYTRVAPDAGFDLSEFPQVTHWIARVERDLGIGSAVEAA